MNLKTLSNGGIGSESSRETESQAQPLPRLTVLLLGRKGCDILFHGARTMDQKSRSLLPLSLGPGRSQSNFASSCFLETLIQCTNLTCMGSICQTLVGQQQKWTLSSETSSCRIGSAH